MAANPAAPAIAAARQATADATPPPLAPLALRALPRMYRPDRQIFAHHVQKTPEGHRLEGVSDRYAAAVLIGLARVAPHAAAEALCGQQPADLCGALAARARRSHEFGEVALALWAARVWRNPGAASLLDRLREMRPAECAVPTVELAWALTAQVVPGAGARDETLIDRIAQRLLDSFVPASGLFPHWPRGAQGGRLRGHICCFADLVYPIQALAGYAQLRGHDRAAAAANQCAQRMVANQGPAGQWWWHHDVRTGRVLEGYPVYAVHQDAMAAMALNSLRDLQGENAAHAAALRRGRAWLDAAPELRGASLIDRDAGWIWRKVFRYEPGKLARTAQSLAAALHPALRVPALDRMLPPRRIDWETRPYHMGWILCAEDPIS